MLSIAASAILLSACVQAPSNFDSAERILPPVKHYSDTQQARVADDIESGRLSPATAQMISDYGIMRDQVRNAKQQLESEQ